MDEAREVVREVLALLPEPYRREPGEDRHTEELGKLVRRYGQRPAQFMRAWPEMRHLDLDDLFAEKGLSRAMQAWGYDGCASLAREFVRLGAPVPAPLDRFVMDVLSGKINRKQRGPRPKEHRDKVIFVAVEEAVAMGLMAYRNDEGGALSACDVVAECLPEFGHALSYKAVAKIYATWRKVASE